MIVRLGHRHFSSCRASTHCLDISLYTFSRASSSDHRITVVATTIRFRPMLATDCPWVWPVGGVSDTISSRFLCCLRRHLWKASRSGIKTVAATIASQRLLGAAVLILLGPPGCEVSFCFTLHSPDAGDLA